MGTNQYNYAYDPIGNRTVATNNDEALSYVANSLNQYSQISNQTSQVSPAYDSDGNMTGYKGWTFVWDAENRLVLASNATTVVSNSYDYMSRRVVKVVNGQAALFTYQGWAMIMETTATATNSYVYGLDLSGTSQGAGTIGGVLAAKFNDATAFYAYDANGNVTDLVGTNGEFLAQYQFDPYGNTISKTGALADVNPFRFSTKYLDAETSLYYYGHRYYSAESGRWVSRDPIEEQGGIDLYVFVINRPTDKRDSNGLTNDPGDWGWPNIPASTPTRSLTLTWAGAAHDSIGYCGSFVRSYDFHVSPVSPLSGAVYQSVAFTASITDYPLDPQFYWEAFDPASPGTLVDSWSWRSLDGTKGSVTIGGVASYRDGPIPASWSTPGDPHRNPLAGGVPSSDVLPFPAISGPKSNIVRHRLVVSWDCTKCSLPLDDPSRKTKINEDSIM